MVLFFLIQIVAHLGMLQMLPEMARSSLEPESSEQAFYSKLTAKGACSRYGMLIYNCALFGWGRSTM